MGSRDAPGFSKGASESSLPSVARRVGVCRRLLPSTLLLWGREEKES